MKADRGERLALAGILLGAFALRVVPALLSPSLCWPDEVFQTLEPAHRAAFGYGLQAWEFREGARSWLLPGLLAGLMKATAWTLPGAWGYFTGVTVALSLLATTPVLVAWAWARRLGEPLALFVAASVAVFCDLVYLGPKALSEVVAGHLLVCGIYFAIFHDDRIRRMVIAGALLGASVVLRVHLAPAVAVVAALAGVEASRRMRVGLLAGGGAVVLLAGLLDALTWGRPFGSFLATLKFNVLEGRAARWGEFPPLQYVGWYGNVWGPGLVCAGAALFAGWRTHRPLVAAVLAIVVTHSVIPHKEYRFVYPATVLISVVMALVGASWTRRCLASRPRLGQGAVLFTSFCALSALAVSRLEPMNTGNFFGQTTTESHFTWLAGPRRAMLALSLDTQVCGLALVKLPWFLSGGYSHLHQHVPVFLIDTPDDFRRVAPAFNTIVSMGSEDVGAPYSLVGCTGEACTFRRSGPCSPMPSYDVNRVLEERGE